MFVRPAAGLLVRDPNHPRKAPIDAAGQEVPESSYWIRCVQSGDVVVVTPDSVVVLDNQIPDSPTEE